MATPLLDSLPHTASDLLARLPELEGKQVKARLILRGHLRAFLYFADVSIRNDNGQLVMRQPGSAPPLSPSNAKRLGSLGGKKHWQNVREQAQEGLRRALEEHGIRAVGSGEEWTEFIKRIASLGVRLPDIVEGVMQAEEERRYPVSLVGHALDAGRLVMQATGNDPNEARKAEAEEERLLLSQILNEDEETRESARQLVKEVRAMIAEYGGKA